MKFLFFNIVVGLALVYLFNAENLAQTGSYESLIKGGIAKIHDMGTSSKKERNDGEHKEIAQVTQKSDSRSIKPTDKESLVDSGTEKNEVAVIPASTNRPLHKDDSDGPTVEQSQDHNQGIEIDQAETAPVKIDREQRIQSLVTAARQRLSDKKMNNVHTGELLPVSDPNVAKRRAEVLGIPETGNAVEIQVAEGESFMTPSVRKRELNNLAQEMELLFVQTMGE